MSTAAKTKRIQVTSEELLNLVRSEVIKKHPELDDEEFEIEFNMDTDYGTYATALAVVD